MPLPTKETIRWLRQLVTTGDTDAMIQLGSIYIHGLYIESNVDEGIKLFEKAGDLGNIGAYSTLAFMYKTGDGVTHDNFQAIKWYEKAVDKDDTAAEMDLAKLYKENEDVKDLEQSFKLYLKVAQKTAKSTNSWDNSSITDAILEVANRTWFSLFASRQVSIGNGVQRFFHQRWNFNWHSGDQRQYRIWERSSGSSPFRKHRSSQSTNSF